MTAPSTNLNRRVPRRVTANLRLRQRILRAARQHPRLQLELWKACRRDALFFINVFCWTYDMRDLDRPAVVPFVTWPFQDKAAAALIASMGKTDVLIEKSRDMGASWLSLALILWLWLFFPHRATLLASRKEDLVDKPEDPDCLMWKLDFMLQWLPGWLRPAAMLRARLHFSNHENGSTIDGESTNGDLGRGGRRTLVLLDEFGAVENGTQILKSTRDLTRTRWFNSTPQGATNAFARLRQRAKMPIVRMHWSEHPGKAKGLYTAKNGKLVKLDETNPWPANYPFVLDGKLRSLWYDGECERCGNNAQEMAQEADINYEGSVYQFFPAPLLERLRRETAREPLIVGELAYEVDTCQPKGFVELAGGPLRLWEPLGWNGRPQPQDTFVVSGDISMGTGASNSSLSVTKKRTGTKVAELATPFLDPTDFAAVAVALAYFYNGALLIWEANGPGRSFGNRVVSLGYAHIWYRQSEDSVKKTLSDVPGWYSTKDNKRGLLDEYRRALGAGEYTNPSAEAIDECGQYVVEAGGRIVHAAGETNDDPTGAGENHGDRVIGDALGHHACKALPVVESDEEPAEPPYGSYAWRQRLHATNEALAARGGWPEF